MKKYYIGLIIIALFTLGLTGFVVTKGASNRQDTQTSKRANEIARELNEYVEQSGVPESLEAAGIDDVPSTITYTKQGEETYEFCTTYKNASDTYGGGFDQVLTGSVQRQFSEENNYYDSYESSYQPSSLYPAYSHKAGKNCQKIKHVDYQSYRYDDYDNFKPNNGLNGAGSFSSSSADTERQTDIKALHAQVEAYYAQNGFYPTLANLNDATWRSTNMKGLDKEALKDPKGSGYTLTGAPAKNSYSYIVLGANGKACDNATTDCTTYTLTATQENGSGYSKYSLN
jgi:hypothetical protein